MKENACCFTGHRRIRKALWESLSDRLKKCVHELYVSGIDTFYTGGALGFDTLAAEAVIQCKIEHPGIQLILAIPCENQTHRWNTEAIERYKSIRKSANEVVLVSKDYDADCMRRRNEFMVDHSCVCVCYLTQKRGGTAYTADYATRQRLKVINLASLERDSKYQ